MTAPAEQQQTTQQQQEPAAKTEAQQQASTEPAATETKGQESSGDVDWQAKYKEMQKHASTWEKRATENQTQLQKIEDQKLSDLERAQKALQERDSKLAQLQQQNDQSSVALEKGLPAEIATTLTGASREEMLAHADRLLTWRGALIPQGAQPNPGAGARPVTQEQLSEVEYQQYMQQYFPQIPIPK